jgi:hypothetical protein
VAGYTEFFRARFVRGVGEGLALDLRPLRFSDCVSEPATVPMAAPTAAPMGPATAPMRAPALPPAIAPTPGRVARFVCAGVAASLERVLRDAGHAGGEETCAGAVRPEVSRCIAGARLFERDFPAVAVRPGEGDDGARRADFFVGMGLGSCGWRNRRGEALIRRASVQPVKGR